MLSFKHTDDSHITRYQLYLVMIAYLCFGSSITIILKIQNTTETLLDGKLYYYQHPLASTLFMFIGELMNGVVYNFTCKKKMDETYETQLFNKKRKLNPLWVSLPAFLDLTGSYMVYFGLTQTQASIYSMVKGFIVVYSALLTYIILKRNQMFHHYIGMGLVVTGVFLVGLTAYFDEQTKQNGNFVLGFIFIVIGQFFQASHIVTQEIFVRKIHLHQLQLTGWEGAWGILYQMILFPVLQNIHCTQDFCNNGKVEDYVLAFRLLFNNHVLLMLTILYIIVIAFYNGLSVTITRYASCVHQCTTDQLRVLFVWVFFMLYPGLANEQFRVMQFIGFIVILCGNFIYNEVVRIGLTNIDDEVKNKLAVDNEFILSHQEHLIDKNDNKIN